MAKEKEKVVALGEKDRGKIGKEMGNTIGGISSERPRTGRRTRMERSRRRRTNDSYLAKRTISTGKVVLRI